MRSPVLKILIGADTGRLRRDMKQADGIVGRFTSAAKLGLASAAAAAGAFAFKLGVDGVQAAIADEASQVKLATALQNTTKATDAQIASVEDYITKTQMRYGVEDVLLRNSLNKLATVTGDVTKAQEMQAVALDVAAGSGLSLEAATTMVTKALQGSFRGFDRLGVVLSDNIKKNKDGAAAVEVLGNKYVGAADKAANTTKGKLDRLNQAWDESVEKVGEALLPELTKLADWAVSPEGGKQIENFINTMATGLQNIVTAAENIGIALDNITPDADTPLGRMLSFAMTNPDWAGPTPNEFFFTKQRPNSPSSFSGYDTTRPGTVINLTVNGASDPVNAGRVIKKTLSQIELNAISPNAGDRRR